jgi:hypothetical protein
MAHVVLAESRQNGLHLLPVPGGGRPAASVKQFASVGSVQLSPLFTDP